VLFRSITGYGQNGILFAPSNGRGTLHVSDPLISSNQFAGIAVNPSSGQIASVTLNRDELIANVSQGLLLEGAGVVAGTMRQTLVGDQDAFGVLANGSQVFFTVEESSIINNVSRGIEANSPGVILNVGATTIGGNGIGVLASSGSINLLRQQPDECQRLKWCLHQHRTAAITALIPNMEDVS